jgi:DNA-dependent protein kinase catalytic subunit
MLYLCCFRYFETLASSMTNTHKPVYAPAAEVVGMVLSYLAEKERETEGNFHSYIWKCLTKVKPDALIVCVHRMHLHYPPIADR